MSDEQTATPDSPAKGSQEDIIARLDAILEPDEGQTDESIEQEAVEETADEVVEEDGDEQETEIEQSAEVEDPTTDSEEEVEADPEVLTEGFIEVDGEKLSVDEIKLGYLRQADYTKKTQAVADQRKAAEQQTANYESSLQALLTAAGADMSRFQNVDWEAAAVQNPDQYKQAKSVYAQTKQTYDFIKSQADDHYAKTQKQQQDQRKTEAAESLTVLKNSIPGWNNDTYYSLGEYAKTVGISSEEFNTTTCHRTILALWKAQQFDQAKAKTTKKIKSSATRTLSGKKAQPTDLGNKETTRKARERLKSSGSMSDAAEALSLLMR